MSYSKGYNPFQEVILVTATVTSPTLVYDLYETNVEGGECRLTGEEVTCIVYTRLCYQRSSIDKHYSVSLEGHK